MGFIDGGRRVANTEAAVDVVNVFVDSGVADGQSVGDFLFQETFTEQREHFVLALGQ